MKLNKLLLLPLAITIIVGCEKEVIKEVEVEKIVEKEVIKEVIKEVTKTVTNTVTNTVNINFPPQEFEFTRLGKSTVFFTGQTTRLKQADALKSAMSDTSSTEAGMLNMFDNGQGFSDASINSETKMVGNKTAAKSANKAVNKAKFDGWIKEFVDNVIPSVVANTNAAAGQAGLISDAGGRQGVKVNGKGHEMNQIFSKSLIGAFNLDQIINEGGYLSKSKLDPANEDNTNGKFYYTGTDGTPSANNITKMEHYWDEGFGYLYGQDNQYKPELGKGSLLNYYLKKVNGSEDVGIAKKIYDAFILGRAAIVSKNYTLRDEQAKIIKIELSKVVGYKAMSYLTDAADHKKSGEMAALFHALSEGYGFIFSLQFTQDSDGKPYMSYEDVNKLLVRLDKDNGFWSRTEVELDAMAAEIKTATGL